jgi:hypothetical protein
MRQPAGTPLSPSSEDRRCERPRIALWPSADLDRVEEVRDMVIEGVRFISQQDVPFLHAVAV